MNKAWLLLLSLAFLPLVADAASGNMGILRGGFGFLYPDNNAVSGGQGFGAFGMSTGANFTNPSALAGAQGTSIQGQYERMSLDTAGNFQTATPSLVYGNGKFGLGVFGERDSLDVTKSNGSIDTVGVGLGAALIKDHLNLGVAYSRMISASPSNSGQVEATLTLMGNRDRGASLGVGFDTILSNKVGNNTQGGTVGVGYAFKHGTSVEANMRLNDLKNTQNYNLEGFVNLSSQMVYFSAGYLYLHQLSNPFALTVASASAAEGRLGFLLGKNFDISAMARKIFVSGTYGNVTWGGTLRVTM